MSIAAPLHLLASTPASHLVHASDADQAEALLTRWGPDGLGKLGSEFPPTGNYFASFTTSLHSDPRWAIPIKARIREANRARAIKPEQHRIANGEDAPLRVINGISTQGSSTISGREYVRLSTTEGTPGRPGNSTIRWGGGLVAHRENKSLKMSPLRCSPRTALRYPSSLKELITPSLAILEKAVSRIYFENLYFPLLRHPPSREQRWLARKRYANYRLVPGKMNSVLVGVRTKQKTSGNSVAKSTSVRLLH